MKNIDIIQALLTPPGDGLYTVNTAKEKKLNLQNYLYKTIDPKKIKASWQKKMKAILNKNNIVVIGIPSDCGGGIHRGANWGPLAIREQWLKNKFFWNDLGDILCIPHLLHDKYLNQITIDACKKSLYDLTNNALNLKLPVSPLSRLEQLCTSLYLHQPDIKIMGLGGDHSVSYPLVKSWLKSRKDISKCAIIQFDAHTDLLDERLGVDLCFGSWSYQILPYLKNPSHLLQIGIRSSGKNKKFWEDNLKVKQIWSQEIKKNKLIKTIDSITKYLNKIKVNEIYISFDIDALDVKFASQTGTPEPDGMSPQECFFIIDELKQNFNITGTDLMEVAPYINPCGISDQLSSLELAGLMGEKLYQCLEN